MFPEIDEHRVYLRDRSRLSAYERALTHVVTPTSIVVDYGAGTGILGMLACRAGASHVYAIEQGGIAGLAREIARANDLAAVLTVVRGNTRDVNLPARADVVVCDQIGAFGLDAGITDVAREARVRFLRPGGVLVPHAIQLCAAAVERAEVHDRVAAWLDRVAGFDLSAAAPIARNTTFPVTLDARNLLTAAASSAPVDLLSDDVWPVEVRAETTATRGGVVHGIGGWFVAHLSAEVVMTNDPASADRICRRQLFLPIGDAVEVAAGAAIALTVRMSSPDVISWSATIDARDGQRKVFRQSSVEGMLLSKEDVLRVAPGHRPRLSTLGAARLTVLGLCDASHSVDEIEKAVYLTHRDLFLSMEEASTFVARILGQDGAG